MTLWSFGHHISATAEAMECLQTTTVRNQRMVLSGEDVKGAVRS